MDLEVDDKSKVSIGTHRLFVSVTGPDRSSHEPAVIVIPGAGDVASSYPAVERLVSAYAPILLYDRSGLGRSEEGPGRHVATVTATELKLLLDAVSVQPPLLLVGHSYGGIIAREYLHLYPNDVAGMVLVECATEKQHHHFRAPDPNISAVLGNLKYADVTGLRSDSKLTRDEWRARAIDIARGQAVALAEATPFVEQCETLGTKNQYKTQFLGDRPLSVICGNSARDYERIYERGVEAGNGTGEQRKSFRKLLDTWAATSRELQEEQLQLSSNSQFVYVGDSGHNVHVTRPDIIAEQIRLVRDKILAGRERETTPRL